MLVQNQQFFEIKGDGDVSEPCQAPNPGVGCGGLRSPDHNGDGLVALGDLSGWQQEFVAPAGSQTFYLGDLAEEFDDLVALGDLSTFQKHFVAP